MNSKNLLKPMYLSIIYSYLISTSLLLINEFINLYFCSSRSYCPSYKEFLYSFVLPFYNFIYPLFISLFFKYIILLVILFWSTFLLTLFSKIKFLEINKTVLLTSLLVLWQFFGYFCLNYLASVY